MAKIPVPTIRLKIKKIALASPSCRRSVLVIYASTSENDQLILDVVVDNISHLHFRQLQVPHVVSYHYYCCLHEERRLHLSQRPLSPPLLATGWSNCQWLMYQVWVYTERKFEISCEHFDNSDHLVGLSDNWLPKI